MSNIPDLSAIELRAQRLLELLDHARLSGLDFDNRENLQVIMLCFDLAIARLEKLSEVTTAG